MRIHQTDFAKQSVWRAILASSFPLIIAELVNLLYSQVDRIYIAHISGIGSVALTGVGLCLPIISLISAFARLFGSNGGGPLCAIELGKGDNQEAERYLGQSFTLTVVTGLVITVLVLIFSRPILYLFGASDQTFPYAQSYLVIYVLGSVPVLISLTLTPFINALGYSSVGMVAVVVGALTNIILDPILIFLFDLGVRGAAIATVISQCISAIFCIAFLRRGHLPIRLRFMPLEGRRVARICLLGTSGFTMGATNSIVQLVCNKCAAIWGGDLYVGVMTILNSIREIFSTPMNGFSSGATPVMSYNYGRGDGRRVMKASQLLLVMMLVYSGLIWALIYILPDPFINLFTTDETLMAASHHALQIYFFGFIFMSFHMSGQQTFVALGYAKQAVFFSLFRKVIIVVPLTIILPYFIGVDGVVLAEPISNVVGGMATYSVMRLTVFRKLRRQLAKASARP